MYKTLVETIVSVLLMKYNKRICRGFKINWQFPSGYKTNYFFIIFFQKNIKTMMIASIILRRIEADKVCNLVDFYLSAY